MESLASKWRPKSFAEVVGQPVIVSILSRQIETKTFKQAYLFVGPPGCGKTSMSRIIANSINNGESEPIEIDAASNNGVDAIRDLIDDAQQTAIDADYKVYIIDECHMLTTAAWNAGLKLIEEPPSHVIFIFCTTNPDKIPETILTRVQRFDFNRISNVDISNRLAYILNEEVVNCKYDEDALNRIANLSNGFMREAISLLDKCLSYSNDITTENVEKVLGLAKYELLVEYNNAVVDKNLEKANECLSNLMLSQTSPLKILDDILELFINCAKLNKFHNIKYTTIPCSYKDRVKICDDEMLFVDRTFRYRTLSNTMDVKNILDVLTLELCGR